MPIHNGPENIDYARAMRLLLFTSTEPPAVHVAGVNQVFDEISEDGRSGPALLALADLAHTLAPDIRSEENMDRMRRHVALYEKEAAEKKENNND
jgi:hypothetical protein